MVKSSLSIRTKRILFLCVFLILITAAFFAYKIFGFLSGIQDTTLFPPTSNPTATKPEAPPVWTGTERVNILLMGVDKREMRPHELPRSDSMMLVSIDPQKKTYDLFSIMRDTLVRIPGHGKTRVNEALAYGGPELAMETVSDFVGQPVHYYLITDFEGFKSLIDAVGGVEIDVEKNMRYHDPTDKGKYDINLKKGLQHLDGEKALQYARFRHDATSDYTRTERQRKLLSALATELKSTTTIFQIPKILDSVQPYIQTNLATLDMIKLGSLGMSLKQSGEGGHQLPPMHMFQEANVPGKGAVLLPSEKDVIKYVDEQLNESNVVEDKEGKQEDPSNTHQDSSIKHAS
ncbi:LCP family protein [Brevibacillus laterosporus]|uniref:LCP family protein n=1 Tax=Brevibacillus laterosporus TaxID=1465 RepID=A0AAP3DL74_BRELA|nr:LCP family protein [Brevibacillus laterosporus]MBM7110713.1 putative transcriptional regulator YvhJ [Brevibacillus laterosporus]MCG7319675.1 LCP family protein [Brevibacillus laterosporus]MCR8981895.1 LCP family protein [Brevibacillus laterosporus]MCZ0809050.1 LCP family protein [Brevibacillus laterosporus]MCZ0827477.1 LCP family protein [Brevibacillus laterosporus]